MMMLSNQSALLPSDVTARYAEGGGGPLIPFDDLPFSQLASGSGRYSCPVCRMEFSDKRNFRHHYMVHSGEKPYACSFCPYRARQTGTLNKHIKLRHTPALGDVVSTKVLQ